ncbi:MAG: Pyruvate/2-oxoacid:ferredoxin oxidoreductase delta subunit [Bacteroidia bacterium]|jgi:ferredoxin-type protein NapH
MSKEGFSISLASPHAPGMDGIQKLGIAIFSLAFLFMLVGMFGPAAKDPALFFYLGFVGSVVGLSMYMVRSILNKPAGVQNNHIFTSSLTNRGLWGWAFGIFLTGFYVALYWGSDQLWNGSPVVVLFDPISRGLFNHAPDRWFLYSFIYTVSILIMGVRAILKYRHSNYQIIRTCSIMFFQLGFAFLIPQFLKAMSQPEYYFSYFWPLDYDILFPGSVEGLLSSGSLGMWMLIISALLTFIVTPILTYFFGKRWYCSWVCGCGGLANTAGDQFRQLSDKSMKAWKIERWMIHSVLVFITGLTILLWVNSYLEGGILGSISHTLTKVYAFLIGQAFAGVVGVGFYPLLGTRVWCRFGCPMAAYLGLLQKYFSRFRITTNGGQCISCGNCSTYCEMGIDVQAYAQRGENIVRSSCVGCGICSTVCPRGVLNLENGSTHTDRENDNPITFGNGGVGLSEMKL